MCFMQKTAYELRLSVWSSDVCSSDRRGSGTAVVGDVFDPTTLDDALDGCVAAYYLVHSLYDAYFERLDAQAARAFGKSAAGRSEESREGKRGASTCRSR